MLSASRPTPEPEGDDALVEMAHRLKTKAGRAVYGLRKQTEEPMFGIVKPVMGWRQMSMRGLDKAQGEWSLVALVWNIKRLLLGSAGAFSWMHRPTYCGHRR